MWSANYLTHMNHVRVSPTDGNRSTQGQRKTLTHLYFVYVSVRPAGARFSKVSKTFRVRKTVCETANRLFWKADHLTCFQAN